MMKNVTKYFSFFILFISAETFAEWWHDDWKFHKALQVDISGIGEADAADRFPVLVKLSGGNFSYFMDVLPKGEDLRFIAADQQTPLKYHIEKYDPLTEIALIWVQVPKTGQAVTTGPVTTETIYMYYGNQEAVSAEDIAGVYDVNQAIVYHFDAVAGPRDATAYENHPAAFSGELLAAGLINGAGRFDTSSVLQLPNSPTLEYQAEQGLSLSFWLNLDRVDDVARLLSITGPSAMSIDNEAGALRVVMGANGNELANEVTPVLLSNGVWHHLGLSIGPEQTIVYVDGKVAASLPGVSAPMAPSIAVGYSPEQSGFVGNVDEFQVSNVQRHRSWFRRSYENQAMGSDIVIFGEDQSAESGGSDSYFTSILSNVSVDGWTVIFLLGIMAAASFVVALGKVFMLSRVKKDNVKFLNAFRNLTDDLGALDRDDREEEVALQESPFMGAIFGSHDHFQSSNLYHLYHVGMHELNQRLVSSSNGELSAQNIAAARAALDAAFVREQQKLNKSMVMLTIAISGGPFLGLLGTVLGVMITFAAIAISGDVNINAIAPGVSAALMTTVAGLIVAIPALFAYNYLSTRIKDITIDMRVFADELLARIAEYHC